MLRASESLEECSAPKRIRSRSTARWMRTGAPSVPPESGKPNRIRRVRSAMRMAAVIRFGPDGSKGVMMDSDAQLRIVDVQEVGEDRLLVHDENAVVPGRAFALSRLSHSPTGPVPPRPNRRARRCL